MPLDPTNTGKRGDGATTRQMLSAPDGAHFIWVNGMLSYPKELARRIGREDLRIESPSFLDGRYHGLEFSGIVVDHAARLTERQYAGLVSASSRIRRNKQGSPCTSPHPIT